VPIPLIAHDSVRAKAEMTNKSKSLATGSPPAVFKNVKVDGQFDCG